MNVEERHLYCNPKPAVRIRLKWDQHKVPKITT
jgi:hypothetical protein